MLVIVYKTPWSDWAWRYMRAPYTGAFGYASRAQALAGWHAWLLRRVQAYYWEAES